MNRIEKEPHTYTDMKRLICLVLFGTVLAVLPSLGQNRTFHGNMAGFIRPSATYMYVRNDTTSLCLDIYDPAPGSETVIDGKSKPTVLFAFGGGFMSGSRNSPSYLPWFRTLTEHGYRVVSIDYRLGLKGMGVAQAGLLRKAIMMGTEDMIDATRWLILNGSALGIDADNIVLAGSSAGAIISLQCVYELYNRTRMVRDLPRDFKYAGVMSYSGAIFSTKGKIRFKEPPCPVLLFHGTADGIVPYSQIKVLWVGFFGTDMIAQRLDRFGYDHAVYRHLNHGHEISWHMSDLTDETFDFLENVVCRGRGGIIDKEVDSNWIEYTTGSAADIYRKRK